MLGCQRWEIQIITALVMSPSGCCACTLVPVAKEWMEFPEKVLVDAVYGMWLALCVLLPFFSSSLRSSLHPKWNGVEVDSPPGPQSSHTQFAVKTVLVEHQERGLLQDHLQKSTLSGRWRFQSPLGPQKRLSSKVPLVGCMMAASQAKGLPPKGTQSVK